MPSEKKDLSIYSDSGIPINSSLLAMNGASLSEVTGGTGYPEGSKIFKCITTKNPPDFSLYFLNFQIIIINLKNFNPDFQKKSFFSIIFQYNATIYYI
ncbi:MAG: hypothetical protein ACD_79C01530G0001 [uncultured bacterium]|nr:MAG: hypothetical protein ACD_79C01530G0001 [uncultured bacterium]